MKYTLPPIQPHTEAKHHILQYHMEQWFPILGRTYNTLRYIDGFSGPGEYRDGEPGSPIVALDAISEHSYFEEFISKGKTVEFLFVDRDAQYIRHLQSKLHQMRWPSIFEIDVQNKPFSDVMKNLLDDTDSFLQQMPPSLIFIDPFGPAGFPLELLAKLARIDRVEVLINLNHSELVRWILPDSSKHITADRLYGSSRWRPALSLLGRDRSEFLVTEYESALKDIGWHGTSFEMVNSQNQTAYHLVFGTGNHKGLEAMKRAMRAASQTGEFRYSDRIDPSQPIFLGFNKEKEYPTEIGDYLFQKYDGQEIHFNQLMVDEINWHRWWLPTDLRKALLYLENGGEPRIAEVRRDDGKNRRRNSYTECYIRFGRVATQPMMF